MSNIPSLQEIKALHKKYAPDTEAYDLIFTHCRIVSEIAEAIVVDKNIDVDKDLVVAGALLHDIGTYSLYQIASTGSKFNEEKYITHGILGYEILKNEGYDEVLCRIASNHIGVGLSREQIKERNLPLPEQDYFAESTEEKIIMYADKFHSKYPRFNKYESYVKWVSQFGQASKDRFEAFSLEFGIPDVEALGEKYGHPIV